MEKARKQRGISKPPWLKRRLPRGPRCSSVEKLLDRLGLETVCTNAKCPNRNECYGEGTATFMIMGRLCTRDCRFCAVAGGRPEPPDPDEAARVAEAAKTLGLMHIVITSVTRDDLPDGGASCFAQTVRLARKACDATVEALTPDFLGDEDSIASVACCDDPPDVYNHNVETVPRLYAEVRPQADYERSLAVLKFVNDNRPGIVIKSGLMVGLGETKEEIFAVMDDLRAGGCDSLTIGQYLQPSLKHLPVKRFVEPKEFDDYSRVAGEKGFTMIASGPFVRSSYHAGELLRKSQSR